MKLLKRLAALAAAALFTGAAATTAYAREVPDLTREGSISVTMTCDGARIGEGTLSLYRVGDIMENDSDYSFVFTEEFAACGFSLDDLESDKLAQDLVRYAKNHGIEPDTRTIPHSGQLVYEGVEPGLYLVEQKEANVEFYPNRWLCTASCKGRYGSRRIHFPHGNTLPPSQDCVPRCNQWLAF